MKAFKIDMENIAAIEQENHDPAKQNQEIDFCFLNK
jgi:hypothetical protein